MKTILIRWLLPIIIEQAIAALQRLAQKSDNTLDDHVVKLVTDNQGELIEEIKINL